MAFELKPGQGTLHHAEKKSEAAPDYTGQLNVDGTMYRIAGWKKTGKNGNWLSLSVEIPRPKAALTSAPQAKPINPDDDLPF
jgi:uncharacterized protein (DUF736 family)